MSDGADQLLQQIAACPNVSQILAGDHGHPCSQVVLSQGVHDIDRFQVPEPWNGDLRLAPLLFVSSNPSVSDVEEYPTWDSPKELVHEFFTHRFGGGRKVWVKDRKRALAKDGTYLRATPYWSEIANRSDELFGRPTVPGVDYALTEIVHCKSRNNAGVDAATTECAARYLPMVLQLSNATVLASVGDKVGPLLRMALGAPPSSTVFGPKEIAGRERIVLFLAQPGSSKPRVIPSVLTSNEITLVVQMLQSGSA